MDPWPLLLLSLSFSTFVSLLYLTSKWKALPPGPLAVPILGNLLWLRRSVSSDLEQVIKELHVKYGPIITLRIGSRPSIIISDRYLAHKALIEHGATFSDRPRPLPAIRFINSNQHNISSSSYGPRWRLLRRNLTTQILHPAKIGHFARGREWVLGLLRRDLMTKSRESLDGTVAPKDSFQFAMFCLLVLMCFGEKLPEKAIWEIRSAHTDFLLYIRKLNVFHFVPVISKYVFRHRLKTVQELRQRQSDIFIPLIRARKAHKESKQSIDEERFIQSYVDSLLDIKLVEEGGRGLTEDEMTSLCNEFLGAGTDTTSTALQWIMAELVKHQRVQGKLLEEIERVVGQSSSEEEIAEEDLQRMPYLKAVIMEGLRRHPPAHLLLPHSVTEDVKFEGYLIPKNALVNFAVAQVGLDGKVWEEPKDFMPERFMAGGEGEGVDITGSREIKMMPFGVGRRICPGVGLAMLHLGYFVANLVREFKWDAIDGEEIDFSEEPQFTVVMKTPLKARVSPRVLH